MTTNNQQQNRVVFGVDTRNGNHWVWNSTSVNGRPWNTHRVSDFFNTREEARTEAVRQARELAAEGWRVSFAD